MQRRMEPMRLVTTALLAGLLLVTLTPVRHAQESRPEGSYCIGPEAPPEGFVAPRSPSEPRVTVSGLKATLSWKDNSSISDLYAIYRRVEPGDPFPDGILGLENETAKVKEEDLTRRTGGRLEYVDDLTFLPQDRTILYEVRALTVYTRNEAPWRCYSVPVRVSVRRDYPGALTGMALDRQIVSVGQSLAVRVRLSAPAPAGGVAIALSSSTPDLVPVAQHLLIAPGATEGTLAVKTQDRRPRIRSVQRVRLTAASGAQWDAEDLLVAPAP
jgi:hypothetical protein